MDDRLWTILQKHLPGPQVPSGHFTYSDRNILEVGLWAILHDRPMNWACEPGNWPKSHRPNYLPHPSTISRRWRQTSLCKTAQQLHQTMVAALPISSRYAAIDGRALPVGPASCDPQARRGHAGGGFGKGYRYHAVVASGVVVCYQVKPLPISEKIVARTLLPQLPLQLNRIVGDGNYDSCPLHEQARREGRRFYAPVRQQRVGQRQQPRRLRMLRLEQHPIGQKLFRSRGAIERTFGRMNNFACGFKGLPPWARRQHRVDRWMWGKTAIYHAWLLLQRAAAA